MYFITNSSDDVNTVDKQVKSPSGTFFAWAAPASASTLNFRDIKGHRVLSAERRSKSYSAARRHVIRSETWTSVRSVLVISKISCNEGRIAVGTSIWDRVLANAQLRYHDNTATSVQSME